MDMISEFEERNAVEESKTFASFDGFSLGCFVQKRCGYQARNSAPIFLPSNRLAARIVTPRNAIAHTPSALATARPVPSS